MLDSAALPLERMLINQAAVIITPPTQSDLDDFSAPTASPRPRAGTPGRISRVEDSRLWLEITLPFVDVDGLTWYYEADVPPSFRDGIGIFRSRTLLIPLPQAAVALLSWERLARPGSDDLIHHPEVVASDAVKLIAQQRLQEAADALREVHELLMIGVEVNQEDDAGLRAVMGEIVTFRVIDNMRRRIQAFFRERPWFWTLQTSVHGYGQDLHVRVEATPDAPNVYQADALDVLGVELAALLEPEACPLTGRFNLTWENAGYGTHLSSPTVPGAATH